MIRVAVVGAGKRIMKVLANLQALNKQVSCAGFFDPAVDYAGKSRQEKFGLSLGVRYSSLRQLLHESAADIVLIGSPNHAHVCQVKACVDSGKKVFVEKPLALNFEESLKLAQAVRKDSFIFVGFVLRSSPIVTQAKEIISTQSFGPLISIDAVEDLSFGHGYFLSNDWRRSQAFGGSYLLDKACHDFDLFNMFTGSRLKLCSCFGGRSIFIGENLSRLSLEREKKRADYEFEDGVQLGDSMAVDTTDNEVMIGEYENGVRIAFHTNTHSAIPRRSFRMTFLSGVIDLDFINNVVVYSHGQKTFGRREVYLPPFNDSHYGGDLRMAKDLLDAIETNNPHFSDHVNALYAGLTVMGIDAARSTGTVFSYGDLWGRLESAFARPI